MTGLYGKLPSYGDFVRRALPGSFVQPWDEWLQACVAWLRESQGASFDEAWARAPAWRFILPAGVCGPARVAGVLLPSTDNVGRAFPLTLAAVLDDHEAQPGAAWFEAVELAGTLARDTRAAVPDLQAQLPEPAPDDESISVGETRLDGWWTADGRRHPARPLPTASQFRAMLVAGAGAPPFTTDARTHPGTVRSRNEDAYLDRSDIGLWVVADGAGGHGSGDQASSAVVQALASLPAGLSASEILAQARLRLGAVHAELQRRAQEDPAGEIMATTTVVLLARGEHFACLWAGDSRAYLLREGELGRMTRDHSLVQELVDAGELSADEAEGHPQANVITRAIGSTEALELDKVAGRVHPGDVYLLCTDGLFKAVPEATIARLLIDGATAADLIDEALKAGARDNTTVVLVRT